MSDHVKKSIDLFERMARIHAEQSAGYRKQYEDTGELWALDQSRISDAYRAAYQTCVDILNDETYFIRKRKMLTL